MAMAMTAASAKRVNSFGHRGGRDTGEAGCYLHLRSRRLYFKADVAVLRSPRVGPGAKAPTPRAVEWLGGSVEKGVAGTGISRSSSMAPSADVGGREWTHRICGFRECGLHTCMRGSRRGELSQRLRQQLAGEEGDDVVELVAGRFERCGVETSGRGAKIPPPQRPEFNYLSGMLRTGEDEKHQDDTGRRDRGVPRRRGEGRGRALRRQVSADTCSLIQFSAACSHRHTNSHQISTGNQLQCARRRHRRNVQPRETGANVALVVVLFLIVSSSSSGTISTSCVACRSKAGGSSGQRRAVTEAKLCKPAA
ncbi:hypothetical protein GUJ93_ZPchr0006g44396 [Zizania palustris]|uniref:Uncharacterized protein n=1 Tax=Zizania palustris TaxID=103762 RepID=A0A8J5SIL8_ZIZPA|nr:hypothetical protein GUJ93_ZPchr0006g44396 [Zizania palustris]